MALFESQALYIPCSRDELYIHGVDGSMEISSLTCRSGFSLVRSKT